MKDTEFLTT